MPKSAKRSRILAAILLLAGLSVAQVSSEFVTDDIRRVGSRLACLCGSCKNSVGDCAMLACGYSSPARQKIAAMQTQNISDDAIVEDFVKREGIRALVTPPAEGFNLMAWLMPPLMIAFGLAIIWWFIQRMRKPAAVPEIDPKLLERYKDSIEKDLAKLD
ncbi:MAG: cytochrome c-type biogenesis protein CcmH [Acidimicrobiia bacterium]|nr:cytochrome c-type biogenesis protein CcmH [Acidimicrobiia bacterium]